MTYFHPRDFDPEQPILPGLNFTRRFKSYFGLSRPYNKLEYILNKHKFINVDIAVHKINWGNVEKVVLD